MSIVERDIFKDIEKVAETDEAVVLTGCRQTGKTTTIRYFYDRLKSSNKLFLDLENVMNRKYFEEENYERIKSAFEFLGLDFSGKAYVFLDEIQYAMNLPSVVKYLKDHYRIKFFLTGSASFYLKHLFSESLSGRKYIFHLYPLTFKEFAAFKGYRPDGDATYPPALDPVLETLFAEYLDFGGFPGVVLKSSISEKRKKLQDIFSSYFEMEVEKLRDFSKTKKVRDALLLLLSRSASLVDVSRLSQELAISRITMEEYLDFFEKTFFFDLISPCSANRDVEIRKRRKLYPVDVGLAKEMGAQEPGALFEAAVYQNLRVGHEVNYYRLKNGQEIDFILNKQCAIEAKGSAREQDVNALKRLAANLKSVKDFYVLTLKKPADGIDRVLWAPRFLLTAPPRSS